MAVMLTGQGIYLVSRRSQPLSQPAVRLVLSLVYDFGPHPAHRRVSYLWTVVFGQVS